MFLPLASLPTKSKEERPPPPSLSPRVFSFCYVYYQWSLTMNVAGRAFYAHHTTTTAASNSNNSRPRESNNEAGEEDPDLVFISDPASWQVFYVNGLAA
jgi:hypothetical protein